jgi:hypothetical protein
MIAQGIQERRSLIEGAIDRQLNPRIHRQHRKGRAAGQASAHAFDTNAACLLHGLFTRVFL